MLTKFKKIKNYFINVTRTLNNLDERLYAIQRKVDEILRMQEIYSMDIINHITSNHKNLDGDVTIQTEYPIAYTSTDHIYPRGTLNDNTRFPRFVGKIENIFKNKKIQYLDLGCAGGGGVFDFFSRGHDAYGIEGSDTSQKHKRAFWGTLEKRLMTADITKPFSLLTKNKTIKQFDLITAWEVLEHIKAHDLPQLFDNIKKHLKPGGLFVASVAMHPDYDPNTGVDWHVTLESKNWWLGKFISNNFEIVENHGFDCYDYPRGTAALVYDDRDFNKNQQLGFHIVLTKN